MNKTIRILHLEDDPFDVKLIQATITSAGIDCGITLVQTRKEYEEALSAGEYDVIIADFNLPDYDGISALRFAQAIRPDVPFIFVSGTMGEDAAIEGFTNGAWDYVTKPKLFRLVPAIGRGMRDAENRRERKQAGAAIEQSRNELKTIYDYAPIMMCVLDTNRTILFANQAFLEFIAKSEGELKGELLGKSLGCEKVFEHQEGRIFEGKCESCALGVTIASSFKEGKSHRAVEYRATIKRGSDRRDVVLLCSTALLKMANQTNLLLCFEDITHRKKAEEERDLLRAEFLQAQKMEAYGRLAGGVAHDFNNLLTVIINCCELALESIEREHPILKFQEIILKTANRAADLTRQLLAFSRKQVLELKIMDLNVVVGELDKMLQRIIGEHIVLKTSLEKNIQPILADPGQIGQVILNLVVNARDAMPNGGRMTISTQCQTLGETGFPAGEVLGGNLREIPHQAYVCLSIEDTGIGISDTVKEHLFEPFFTTKRPGEGTGLGLSTVFGIVKQCHGHILMQTAVGQGTVFHILLPIANSSDLEKPIQPLIKQESGGGETILVVEDSEDLRLLTHQILEKKGFTILSASNGEDALRLCQTHPGQIHLLLSDIIMPGMTGPELWKTLLENRPEMRVLFVSGYSAGEVSEIPPLQQSLPFLQKPFSGNALLEKVQEALEGLPRRK
jgi:hypothetical protein